MGPFVFDRGDLRVSREREKAKKIEMCGGMCVRGKQPRGRRQSVKVFAVAKTVFGRNKMHHCNKTKHGGPKMVRCFEQ